MIVTVDWIKKHYIKFNKLYFENKLPIVKFEVNHARVNWGWAGFIYDYRHNTIIPDNLIMSNYYDSPEYVLIQTLLHEMIHIKDYVEHPEHFIKNGRRVSRRSYDAHGWWFNWEAQRLSKKSGYSIANHVTADEVKVSTVASQNDRNKINKALICTIIGRNGIWYFKTDTDKVNYIKSHINSMANWDFLIGGLKSVKFYTFNCPQLAARRSCCTHIIGWKTDRFGLADKLKKIKATEVKF